MEDPKLAKTALIVMGMQRSGTTALAGVVVFLGAELPQDLMARTEMNAEGFQFVSRLVGAATGRHPDLPAAHGDRALR